MGGSPGSARAGRNFPQAIGQSDLLAEQDKRAAYTCPFKLYLNVEAIRSLLGPSAGGGLLAEGFGHRSDQDLTI
jgi:hypothetical protein